MVILVVFTISMVNTVYYSQSDQGLNVIDLTYINNIARADGESSTTCHNKTQCPPDYTTELWPNGTVKTCCGENKPGERGHYMG